MEPIPKEGSTPSDSGAGRLFDAPEVVPHSDLIPLDEDVSNHIILDTTAEGLISVTPGTELKEHVHEELPAELSSEPTSPSIWRKGNKFKLIAAIIAMAVIVALGGGIGGSLAVRKNHMTATPEATSTTPSAPLPSGSRNIVRSGSSLAAISWGTGPNYQARVYYQMADGNVQESSYRNGQWQNVTNTLLKAKLDTPLAAIVYPYRKNGTGDLSNVVYDEDGNYTVRLRVLNI
jgi:hypothetical protein